MAIIFRDINGVHEFWDGGKWVQARAQAKEFPTVDDAILHACQSSAQGWSVTPVQP